MHFNEMFIPKFPFLQRIPTQYWCKQMCVYMYNYVCIYVCIYIPILK